MRRKSILMQALLLTTMSLAFGGLIRSSQSEDPKPESMVYELRTYTTLEGRLPALHARFADHTMRLFEKHGMQNVIYWVPADRENTLVYVLAHKSREAADASWKGFIGDPEWHAARDASEKDGKIVARVERQYLLPVEYSPRK